MANKRRYCYIKWVIFHNHIDIVKKIIVELDFSNYVIKCDLNEATNIDISKFIKKGNLTSLKANFYRLEIE